MILCPMFNLTINKKYNFILRKRLIIDYVRNIRKTYYNRSGPLFDIHKISYSIRIQDVNFKEKFIKTLIKINKKTFYRIII